jgi:hypothetical protein
MADTTFGFTYNGTWAGVITSVDDPNKSGRVQVRIYGHTDDTVNIPDDCLPWIMPLQPITSAASSKVGTSPVGVIVGTNVFGIWSDSDMQIPIILGSWGKDGIISSGSSTSDGAPKIDTTKGSIPPAAVGIENNPRSVLN